MDAGGAHQSGCARPAASQGPRRYERGRCERGFVLLVALLALIVLAALGAGMVSLTRGGVQVVTLRRDSAVLEAAADGAMHRAVFNLLRSEAGQRTQGMTYDMTLPGAKARIRWQELGGRVNPNLASAALFEALLVTSGADRATSGRVGAALLAARASVPFEDVAALAGLPGMTPALLAALAPHLSVWWPGPPDPALADPSVGRALALAGEEDLAAATRPEERVVQIEATVAGTSGRTMVRRAVVRLALGLDGLSWHVLMWDRGAT